MFGAGIALGGGFDALTVTAASCLGAGVVLLSLRKSATSVGVDGVEQNGVDYIAIVPWGILVHSQAEPRVVRWGGIESISVRYVHEMDDATPVLRWSIVTLRTRHGTLVGRSRDTVALERLQAYLSRYAEEAGRPIALDLDAECGASNDFEPVFLRLHSYVRRLLRSPASMPDLGLTGGGYRGGIQRQLSARGLALLNRWICDSEPEWADRRPLAFILAAELEAHALLKALVERVTSPHPFVAAVARAAAVRLGADIRHVGSLDELGEFLEARELEPLMRWSQGQFGAVTKPSVGAGT
jgi:hypothetical protein